MEPLDVPEKPEKGVGPCQEVLVGSEWGLDTWPRIPVPVSYIPVLHPSIYLQEVIN